MNLPKSSNIQRAKEFATKAHGTQVRKYTGEPYINHPIEVATLVARYGATEDVVVAALLHDVVEDTDVTLAEIAEAFGQNVASLVEQVTDVSMSSTANRASRKALDRAHLARSSHYAASIKLADLISNAKDIGIADPKFAKVYMAEKRALLGVLTHGNKALLDLATRTLLAYEKQVAEEERASKEKV
jgi:(p)ppGpp synthase/HD superfamily hydrolase